MNQSKQILSLLVFAIAFASASVAQEEPVWFWFATCGGPTMTLEVQLDSAVIYKATFPLCQTNRNSAESQGQRTGKIDFLLRPGREITWSGYKDIDVTTKADQLIEGGLWQAGAESEGLLIGISFMDKSQIYMNTIHIAYPTRHIQTTVASGLVVVTYPAESTSDSQQPRTR